MKAKLRGLVVCAFASGLLSSTVAVQARAETASTYKAPRNSFGQPELSGTWSNDTLTHMERDAAFGDRLTPTPDEVRKLEGERAATVSEGSSKSNLTGGPSEAFRARCEDPKTAFSAGCGYNTAFSDTTLHLMTVNGQPRTSFITFPANGRIPRKPGGKPRPDVWGEGVRDNPENRGLPDRCLVSQNISTGALLNPTIYNNTVLFQQNKDTMVIVTEMSHDARTIRLNAKHDDIKRWFGDSVGHWEGDTLVVDTINFHPEQLDFNSDQLHLVERFTRVGPDRVLYQFKVEDPAAYTAAWGGEYEFHTAKGLQYEYACHEGNYAMHDILAGAREDERNGVTKTASAAAGGGE